jgi:gamma-glutamyltranspeptidase/glutathione hydrolase
VARLGAEVGRALAADLAAVSGPLLADPAARAAFGAATGPGAALVQPDLGATLGQIRTAGAGDLYQGALARRLEEASVPAGGALTVAEMRGAVARIAPPLRVQAGQDVISFLPPPADGGLAAGAAFVALQGGAAPEAAAGRGLAAARAWRDGAGQPAALLAAAPAGPAAWPALPASTGLVVLDRQGMAVSCAFTMNNLFGTGRVAPGTGILLAAAPGIGAVEPPLLSAAIAHNTNLRAFRAAAAGSGQAAAPMAVAAPMAAMLRGADANAAAGTAPEPGRSQAATCMRYLPGVAEACSVASDPRGAGLAAGALDR